MIKTKYEAVLVDQELFLAELEGHMAVALEASRKKFRYYMDHFDFGDDSAAAVSAYLDYARTDERRRTIADIICRYKRMFDL